MNLQFCNLAVNYDLPRNPQRIEQRIGHCYRNGQKFDVAVVNFREIDRQKDALLDEISRRLEQQIDQKPLFALRWRLV
ncbi:MAG TPA: hypothetical protein DEP84_04305 [Chloroflexi bacterium]|nr:hypothetical protein [Chloroflexota bacterium]